MPTSLCDTLIYADMLATQNARRDVIEDAAVAVAGGIIVAVGPRADISASYTPETTLDLGASLLMPGLVNTHTHAAMTAFRGFADDLRLMDWLTNHIWPVENRISGEIVHAGTLLACAEMISTGTTCFADMYLFEQDAARAVSTAGMRAVLGEGVLSFATREYETPGEAFGHIESMHQAFGQLPLVGAAVAPHALYTNSPEVLQESFALAERLDIPWMIHLSETAGETADCVKQYGKRPAAHLAELGCLSPRSVLVHCVDLDEEDAALIARHGATASHNPASNMKLGCGVAPVAMMRDAGIRVGLGTDGAGSSNDLNMFSAMRHACLLAKVHALDPTTLPAQAALDMATRDGASLLGISQLGSVSPGNAADLTALDLTRPNLAPLYGPTSHEVYSATGAEVNMTMCAGRVLYRDGEFTGLDKAELAHCARLVSRWAKT